MPPEREGDLQRYVSHYVSDGEHVNPEDASGLVVATLTVLGALLQTARLWPAGRRRNEIKADLDLYTLLPDKSPAKRTLLTHIERAIQDVVHAEESKRRDPLGIGIAVVFLLGALLLFILLRDQWWTWLAISFLVLFGVVGLAQDAVPRERDARGRPVQKG
jgi:hypothetical protein